MSALPRPASARLQPLQPLGTTAAAAVAKPLQPWSKQPLPPSQTATAKSAAAPAQFSESDSDADLQKLLTLVRERYATTDASEGAAKPSTDAAAAATSAPVSTAPTTAPAASPVSVTAAAAKSATFSGAAAEANVDKLAILMSLFKSRGMEPPPLPLPRFDSFDDEGPAASAVVPEPQSAASKPAASTAAPTRADDAAPGSADLAQLSLLFSHARNKVLKVSRLYQSGALAGAGSAQALQKLGGLTRTYFAFIQHAKGHAHFNTLVEQDAAVRGDVQCTSVHELSERLYAEAKQ